jgi:hypothetical protein
MAVEDMRFERGAAKVREVYAGNVIDLSEGTTPFNDVMVRTLFGEGWACDGLDFRWRRLLLIDDARPYAGYPNVSGLCEEAIYQWEMDGELGPAEPVS